jgi:catecholate siderophore receptor
VITAPRFVDNTSTLLNRQLQARDLVDGIAIWQNDLNAEFATGALDHALVAGVEVARETAESRARTAPTAPTADLFNPNPDDPYTGALTYTGARTESTADTVALYASDTIEIDEHWQLTAGLRYDHFDIDFESVAVGGVMTPFGRTDEMLSWRGGVVFKPRANGSVYASYGTSFNPSSDGATGLTLAATTVDLEPEKSRGFEVGTKWDLLEARMQVTAAAFRTEKTNARTPGLPGEPAIVLAGEQQVEGVELGLSGRLTERWNAYLGYTLLSSEVLESNTPAEVGKELPNTPEHSFSLWTTYRLFRGFEVGGGMQFVDDRFNSATNVRRAPSYTLYDAMASYDLNSRLTLRLNVNNLTDERYIDRVGGGHFIPGAGRSATLSTSFRF